MTERNTETLGCLDMQEFVDTGANDPNELAALTHQMRRGRRRAALRKWFVVALATTAVLAAGILLGVLLK